MAETLSQRAIDLIIQLEVTSQAVYQSQYQHPTWPKGASGVTIGIGYDLGYVTAAGLQSDWGGALDAGAIAALGPAVGVKGAPAQALAKSLAAVTVPWDAACAVFAAATLPKTVAETVAALPNTDQLDGDCLGALVSLVYNRGPSFAAAGDRYIEMRQIKADMAAQTFDDIPVQLRAMKRLWPDSPGLQSRREQEAVLFEGGLALSQAGLG